jgi:hypothetical protein
VEPLDKHLPNRTVTKLEADCYKADDEKGATGQTFADRFHLPWREQEGEPANSCRLILRNPNFTVSRKLMGKRLVARCPRAKHPHQSSAQPTRPVMEKSVEPQAPANFVAHPATS